MAVAKNTENTMNDFGGIPVMDVLGPTPIYDFLSLVSAFVVYGNSGIMCLNGLIVEEFLRDYQAGEALTTWVASLQIALSYISGYLAGTLVELYGNRVVTVTGTLVGVLGFTATAFTTHVGQLFVTYSLLTGVGLGLQFVPTLVVPQYVFPKRRVLAVSIILAGCSTGVFVLPVMFNYFREEYGYRGALLLWAGIMLHSCPLGLLMTMHPQLPHLPGDARPAPNCGEDAGNGGDPGASPSETETETTTRIAAKEDHTRRTEHQIEVRSAQKPNDNHHVIVRNDSPKTDATLLENNTQAANGEQQYHGVEPPAIQKNSSGNDSYGRPSVGAEFRLVFIEMKHSFLELRDGSCRVLIAVVFLYACGYMMPYIFLPAKALGLGLSKSQAAWLVATIGVTETCVRLITGVIIYIFKKQLVIFYGISMFLSGLGCIAMIMATGFNGFLVSGILYGCGIGSNVCIYTQAAIAIIGLSKIVRMIGLTSLVWGLGYLIFPSLAAVLYEVTGNVDVPFCMGSSVQLLAALILLSYRVAPMYQTRPGALDAVLEKDREEGSSEVPPRDVIQLST